jgi:hypothetical protein
MSNAKTKKRWFPSGQHRQETAAKTPKVLVWTGQGL